MSTPNRAGDEQAELPLVQDLGFEIRAAKMRDVGGEECAPVIGAATRLSQSVTLALRDRSQLVFEI